MILSYHPFPDVTDIPFEQNIESAEQGILFSAALELYLRSLNIIPRLASAFHKDFTFLNDDKSVHPLNNELIEMVINHRFLQSDPNDTLETIAKNNSAKGILYIPYDESSPISRLALPVASTLNAKTYVELFVILDNYLLEANEDIFESLYENIEFNLLVSNDDGGPWAEWSDSERSIDSFSELLSFEISDFSGIESFMDVFDNKLELFFDGDLTAGGEGGIKPLCDITFALAHKFIAANLNSPRALTESIIEYYSDILHMPIESDDTSLLDIIIQHQIKHSFAYQLAQSEGCEDEMEMIASITSKLITLKAEDPEELFEMIFNHNEDFLHTEICTCDEDSVILDVFAHAFGLSMLEDAIEKGVEMGLYQKNESGINLTPNANPNQNRNLH